MSDNYQELEEELEGLGDVNRLLSELHTRQEIERLADELSYNENFIVGVAYQDGQWFISDFRAKKDGKPMISHGPYTLQELKAKLIELNEAQSE